MRCLVETVFAQKLPGSALHPTATSVAVLVKSGNQSTSIRGRRIGGLGTSSMCRSRRNTSNLISQQETQMGVNTRHPILSTLAIDLTSAMNTRVTSHTVMGGR